MLDYIQTFPDWWEQSEGGAFRSCCNSLKFGGFIEGGIKRGRKDITCIRKIHNKRFNPEEKGKRIKKEQEADNLKKK